MASSIETRFQNGISRVTCRLNAAFNVEGRLATRWNSYNWRPNTHITGYRTSSRVPHPTDSGVNAPSILGQVVSVAASGEFGVQYDWGPSTMIGFIHIGHARDTAWVSWSDLTLFEYKVVREWAAGVIEEHQHLGWPITINSAGRYNLADQHWNDARLGAMPNEPEVLTYGGSWEDRRNAVQLFSAPAAGEASVSATATTDSLPARPVQYAAQADSDSSDSDDGFDSDYAPAPAGNVTAAAAPPTRVTGSVPGTLKFASPWFQNGRLNQLCPVCGKRFSDCEGVRENCKERAIKYHMMEHAGSKGDPRHQGLAAQLKAEDPDINNFRTAQPLPGAAPGRTNWTENSDSQWGGYLREYNRFKRMSAYDQRTAGKKLLGIVATVDGYLRRKSLRITRQAVSNDLQLDLAFYDLWDYADGTHFNACWDYADGTAPVKPPFPPPLP